MRVRCLTCQWIGDNQYGKPYWPCPRCRGAYAVYADLPKDDLFEIRQAVKRAA